MRILRNAAFVLLVAIVVFNARIQGIGVYQDWKAYYDCDVDQGPGTTYGNYTYFDAWCPNTGGLVCDPEHSPEWEYTLADLESACNDWCENPDDPDGAKSGCMYNGDVELFNYDTECYMICSCLCL